MSEREPVDLSRVTVSEWQNWLVQGILGMSGLGGHSTVEHAFEPYAGFIGRSRELIWVDELAKFVLALEPEQRRNFDLAADAAFTALASSALKTHWICVLNLIDLLRSVNAPRRSEGLAALAEALDVDTFLESGVRSRLAAAGLLAAAEAEGRDRLRVRPAAMKLAESLLKTKEGQKMAASQIRKHLIRIGVDTRDLMSLGIAGDSAQTHREVTLRHRLTIGIEEEVEAHV